MNSLNMHIISSLSFLLSLITLLYSYHFFISVFSLFSSIYHHSSLFLSLFSLSLISLVSSHYFSRSYFFPSSPCVLSSSLFSLSHSRTFFTYIIALHDKDPLIVNQVQLFNLQFRHFHIFNTSIHFNTPFHYSRLQYKPSNDPIPKSCLCKNLLLHPLT